MLRGLFLYSLQSTLVIFLQEKIQSNEKKLQCHTSGVLKAISTRGSSQEENRKTPILSRIDRPLCKFSGFSPVSGDKDHSNQDVLSATSIKIPYIERLPPYTSWIFLDRCFNFQIINFSPDGSVVQFFFSKLKLPAFHFKTETEISKFIDR